MVATALSEQILFPLDLLDPQDGPLPTNRCDRWWLLHTKSRQEKVVAQELCRRDLGVYLPLIRRRSLSRGRPRDAFVPLFPSYVFLNGDTSARLAALKTNRLAAVHAVADGDRLRRDLSALANMISLGAPLTPEDRLEPGQRVRVKSGPCAGLEGVMVKRHNGGKLVVWVEQLMRGASVAFDDYCVEAIS